MKKVLVALVCTLGAVACGEGRPAEDPSMRTTTVTTETTTTGAARPNTANTARTADANAVGAAKPAARDGVDSTHAAKSDAEYGTLNAGSTSTAAAPAPAVGATATTGVAPGTDNPGVANNTKDATNTKINDRDRHGAVTPTDQGGGKDRDITAAIRRQVVVDSGLSFTAKNVKIITKDGKVTLRGPVKSEQEKTTIEAKAKTTPGVSEVDNQLEVKK